MTNALVLHKDKEAVVQSFKMLAADGVYSEELYFDL